MPIAPTARDRWLALGLLLAVLALAYLLLVHPWFTAPLQVINDEIAGLQQREQRIQAQLAQQPQIREQLQRVRAELTTRPGLLMDATAEGAAAALGVRLQDVVAAASPGNQACAISNRTPLADHRMEEGFERVAMQVRLRCGVDEMAQVLHMLETGTPRLFIENLTLLAQRYQQAVQQETGTGLDVSFELVGYLQPAASRPPASEPAAEPAAAASVAGPGGAATTPAASDPAMTDDAADADGNGAEDGSGAAGLPPTEGDADDGR